MSGERFIVCDVLNFIQNGLNDVSDKVLCEMCVENFDRQEIIEGRRILYESLDAKYQMRTIYYDTQGYFSVRDIINCLKGYGNKNDIATFVVKKRRKLPQDAMANSINQMKLEISALKKSFARMEHQLAAGNPEGHRRCGHVFRATESPVPTAESPEILLLQTLADANDRPKLLVYGKIDSDDLKSFIKLPNELAKSKVKKLRPRRSRSAIYGRNSSNDGSSS